MVVFQQLRLGERKQIWTLLTVPEKAALTGARQKPSEVWLDNEVVAVRSLPDNLTGGNISETYELDSILNMPVARPDQINAFRSPAMVVPAR